MKNTLVVAVLLSAATAAAHDVPGTAIDLDFGERTVAGELELPRRQLMTAMGITSEPSGEAIRAYLTLHLAAYAPSGAAFTLQLGDVERYAARDDDFYRVRFTLDAPPNANARRLQLDYDAIVDAVQTHNIFVFARRDLWDGTSDDTPRPLGFMHYQARSLQIDRSSGSATRGLATSFVMGARHIAEGSDHLAFLVMLLLPALLTASRGRWMGAKSWRESVRAIAWVVTAFTVGHSAALATVVIASPTLPTRLIESAIAASVLVGAIHALRPLFPAREAAIAAVFGLVHGLAFGAALRGYGFDRWTLAVGLGGFNLGIEAMQLAIVGVLLPVLLVLRTTRLYTPLRVLGACAGACAALIWLSERVV